jgi:hypothetical protein
MASNGLKIPFIVNLQDVVVGLIVTLVDAGMGKNIDLFLEKHTGNTPKAGALVQ